MASADTPINASINCLREYQRYAHRHKVGFIYVPKSAAWFLPYYELPIIWHEILNPLEVRVLQFRHFLDVACTVFNKDSCYLFGGEKIYVECRCTDPKSLHCQALARCVIMLIEKFFAGTLYNKMFPFYRSSVNRSLPNLILYQGSALLRQKHYIYLRVKRDNHFFYLKQKMSFGHSYFVEAPLGNFIVLICHYCQGGTELHTRICAKRTRRFLLRAVKLLCKWEGKSFKPSRREPIRQKILQDFYTHHRSFCFVEFDTACKAHTP